MRDRSSPPPAHSRTQKCRHRGEEIGTEECPTCRGSVKVKVFTCDVHEECTLVKQLDDVACCRRCDDYAAP